MNVPVIPPLLNEGYDHMEHHAKAKHIDDDINAEGNGICLIKYEPDAIVNEIHKNAIDCVQIRLPFANEYRIWNHA